MRKGSVIFSGFMGALLLSYGARAADAQIASKQYVDNKETAILETVSSTYETKENVTNLTEQVTQLGDTINNPESGLSPKLDKAAQDASDAKGAVDALTVTVEGKEDKSNKAASISAENQSSPDQYPSVGAIVQWTNDKINELSETGLPVSPDNIGEGAITTEKIANDAVTEDKLSNDVVSKIDGKEDKTNKIQSITPESTADQYPSAVAVRDALANKVDSSVLSEYATTEAMNSALEGKVDDAEISDMLTKTVASSTYETKENASSTYATKTELSGYATTAQLGQKVEANVAIEPGTGTKVTYDAKGLVTGSESLSVSDLPDSIPTSKIQGLATVATTGSYNDLSDLPDIPEGAVIDAELTPEGTNAVQGKVIYEALQGKQDKGDYATKTELTDGLAEKADKTALDNYATTGTVDLKEDKSNIVQTVRSSAEAEETKYTSEKAVATALEGKADTSALDALATKEELEQKADASALSAYATTEAMNSALANKADSSALTEGLAKKEDSANKRIVVRDSETATDIDYPSEKAVRTELDKKANKGTTLAEYGITDAYTKGETDSAITSAVEGVVAGDFSDAMKGKEDTSNKITAIDSSNKTSTDKYTSVKAVVDYVIPKPDVSCQAESNLCVLSVDRDGNIKWVNVTEPAQ